MVQSNVRDTLAGWSKGVDYRGTPSALSPATSIPRGDESPVLAQTAFRPMVPPAAAHGPAHETKL